LLCVRHYSADKDIDSKISTNVVVSSDGKCKWIPPGLFESSCAIDISWFPYDEQVCFLKFGSWTYNGFQLDLRLSKDTFDLTNYVSNGQWELLGTVTYLHRIEYSLSLQFNPRSSIAPIFGS